VSRLTVDILSSFCGVFMVKLMLRIFEFGVLLSDCFVYLQNVTCLKRITKYNKHNTGELEDIIIGRLAVVSKSLCQKLQRLLAV